MVRKYTEKKDLIELNGVITRNDRKKMSDTECETLLDIFLENLNKLGYGFAGSVSPLTEKEYLE